MAFDPNNSNSSAGINLTDAQKKAGKKVLEGMINSLRQENKRVANDKFGYETLMSATTHSDPTSSDNDDKKGDDKPKDDKKKESNMTNLWTLFKDAATKTSEWANDFLTKLEESQGIQSKTRKEIVNVCKEYQHLLEDTSLKLQKYRKEVEKMILVFDNVMMVMVPPEDIKKDLLKLSKSDRIDQINKFATQNKNELEKRLKELKALVGNKTSVDELYKLKGNWGALSDKITNVLENVKSDLEAFRKKMTIMLGAALIFVAVISAVAIVCTGGAAAAAIVPLLGTVGSCVVAGIVLAGVAVFGALLIAMPEVGEALKIAQDDTMKQIHKGLDHIATQSKRMEQMLFEIYKSWLEVQDDVPDENSISYVWGSVRVQNLLLQMKKTRDGLQTLVDEIKGTEAVCDTELKNYTEKVYKPLLKIYH